MSEYIYELILSHLRAMIIAIFITTLFPLVRIGAAELDDSAFRAFEAATQMRSDGQYEKAAVALIAILEGHLGDEAVMRRAYIEIVFTLLLMEESDKAEQYAREALLKFPDLSVSPTLFPSSVRDFLDGLRRRLFGSLVLETDPPGCKVLIKDYAELVSPVSIENVPVGSYETRIAHDGYFDNKIILVIDPEEETFLAVKLDQYSKFGKSGRFRPGLDIGVNSVFLRTDEKSAVRFSVGLFADIGMTPRFFFEPGFRFVRLGAKEAAIPGNPSWATIEGLNLVDDVYLDYLSIPLLLKYYIFGSSGVYVLVGPEVGILVRSSSGIDQEQSMLTEGYLDRYNVVINCGIGYKIESAFIGVSISTGLKNVLTDLSGDFEWKTREIRISSGFVY